MEENQKTKKNKNKQNILQELNNPLSKEQLEKIIYGIFCIITFLMPAIPELLGFGIYSLKNTIFIFSTLTTALALVIINRKNIKLNIYDLFLSIYLILVILSTLFSKQGVIECILGTNGRGEGLLTIGSYLATFVIFSRGYKKMKGESKVAIIAAIIVAIYSFIQANITGGMDTLFIPGSYKNIATGTMSNQNFLSSYICIFLPMLCFYYINGTDKIKRTLLIVIMLFMALIYSTTLGGYITFAVMYIIISLFSIFFSKKRKETIFRIGILCITLLGVFQLMNYNHDDTYLNEVLSSKEEIKQLVNKEDNFGSGRLEIWKESMNMVQDNKLLGVGPDSIAEVPKEDRITLKNENNESLGLRVDKIHSEPLQIAATTGVPSAIIYLILVVIVGIKLLVKVIINTKEKGIKDNCVRYETMVLIAFASYFMQSVINISVVQVAPMYWAIFGTAAGILLNSKKEKVKMK